VTCPNDREAKLPAFGACAANGGFVRIPAFQKLRSSAPRACKARSPEVRSALRLALHPPLLSLHLLPSLFARGSEVRATPLLDGYGKRVATAWRFQETAQFSWICACKKGVREKSRTLATWRTRGAEPQGQSAAGAGLKGRASGDRALAVALGAAPPACFSC
jgi:hypothetical protein